MDRAFSWAVMVIGLVMLAIGLSAAGVDYWPRVGITAGVILIASSTVHLEAKK